MSKTKTARSVLIDTDCGVDDAMALILALRSPELNVRSIVTVCGNVEVPQCTRNVLTVLRLLGGQTHVQVSQGSSRPLARRLVTAKEVHGKDGLGNLSSLRRSRIRVHVPRNGHRVISEFCTTWKQEGTIIAIGPLTNIARALLRFPSALRKVGRIISMGGAFRVPGNTGPVAEFNYFVDPEAAEAVITAGLPLEIIPLDITHQVALMRHELETLQRTRPGRISDFVSRVTRFYMQYHDLTEGFNGGYLHDPVAVAAAVDPSMFEFTRAEVAVETRGKLTRGMCLRFGEPPNILPDGTRARTGSVRVAQRIDRERFLSWFHERMWGEGPPA